MFEKGHKFVGAHTFKKGQSGNPKGRPPAANSIAGLVRDKTKGGEYLVERALELSKSSDESVALRALEFLASYGFLKPSQEAENNQNPVMSLLALIETARKERGLDA